MRNSELATIASVFSVVRMAPKKRFPETLYLRLPEGTLERITALQGSLPQGEWMRALIIGALDEREREVARRNGREMPHAEPSPTGDED